VINAIEQVGDDLYAFASSVDISPVDGLTWAHTFNRIYQPQEVTDGGYPTLMVVPAEDEGTTLDSYTDADRIVYWVVISVSTAEVFMGGEGQIRKIADVVRNAVRQERINPAGVFGVGDTYDLQFAGTWGWDDTRSERFYKLVVTINVAQAFE